MKQFALVVFVLIGILHAAGFSTEGLTRDIVLKSRYVVRVQRISYVVTRDVKTFPNMMGGCNYYDHIDTFLVLDTYKGNLPKYMTVRATNEYCGKIKLEQSGTYDNKVLILGFDRRENYFYQTNWDFILPDDNKLIKIIKNILR